MKKYLVFIALAAASTAQASSVKIDTVDAEYTAPTSSFGANVTLQDYRFQVNPELGRARIELVYTSDTTSSGDDSYYGPSTNQVLVAGLSFDAAVSQVVYKNADGKTTACATVQISNGHFGRHIQVKKTGLCTVRTELQNLSSDDGWQIRHRKVLNAMLNIQD